MTSATIITVLAALLLPGILYICIAVRSAKQIHSVLEFLPLKRFLPADTVGATVVAAGMSMATVMVALINLSPLLGAALFSTVITYTGGLLLLSIGVKRIMRLNTDNLVLQAFLGREYSSSAVRNAATVFTLVGYLSVFSMELLASVVLLEPFFGSYILGFAFIYLVFLLVYTGLSGFRGVVATDKWQLGFIFLSLVALLVLIVNSIYDSNEALFASPQLKDLLTSWKAPVAFFVGVAAMNIPAPFSDTGTWQRICAARTPVVAKRGLLAACGLFVVIWGTLIIFGIILSSLSFITSSWNPQSEPLMTAVLNVLGSGSTIHLGILFALILGLFSAMISTADSLLIAATQIGLTGFWKHDRIIAQPKIALRQSRWSVLILGIGAFTAFSVFHLLGLNIVQLVFAIYGAQLALFPTTAAVLFFRDRLDLAQLRYFALFSIIVGFSSAWLSAIWGHSTGSTDLQFYAPAFGLLGATCILILGLPFARRVAEH